MGTGPDHAHHTLTLWTNDPAMAARADAAGVDRIGLDLESLGKAQRQHGLPTWISPHGWEDFARIGPAVRRAALFARANPLHPGSAAEVERLVRVGVEFIMLPNFTQAVEVERFLTLVAGRAEVVPLVERVAAVETIPALARLGIAEIHVGLNDLSIDLDEPNRLVLLAKPLMDRIAGLAHGSDLRFGLGGLGRAGDDTLAVPTDLVYAQHARLGARAALLARSFLLPGMDARRFADEIDRLRARLARWREAPPEALERARLTLLSYATA